MKLTLFTISNEQIKESLNKLQTKVESLETVKEVQDKIIATKKKRRTSSFFFNLNLELSVALK
ncbi:hypothetical protein MRBLBA71_001506 [Bacillus nitratireducens]|uniref:hypothetical protein n=1 Tax=Bacillus nitratireducens TaxID=2026193 RepID=UPI003465329B